MKPGSSLGKFEETSEGGQDVMSCRADNDDYVCFWDSNAVGVSHNSTFFFNSLTDFHKTLYKH